jgi:hypothetical protein
MTTPHRFNKEFILRSKFCLVAYIVIGGHGTSCFGASTIKERSGRTKNGVKEKKKLYIYIYRCVIIWNSKFPTACSCAFFSLLLDAAIFYFLFLAKSAKSIVEAIFFFTVRFCQLN